MQTLRLILSACTFLVVLGCRTDIPKPFIAVNLTGYNSPDLKQALLVNAEAEYFEIVDAASSEVVYEGIAGPSSPPDRSTGDRTLLIDFSEFRGHGNFFVRTKGTNKVESRSFSIGDNVYQQVTLAAIQSYYYSRCGTAVANNGAWNHPVCHLGDGLFYADPSLYRNVTGGWHDAGDYNKFSVNTALSAALLLYLYEVRSALFEDGQLDIPELSNGVPDLLDEVRWSLTWLLKLQDPNGGIYHKVSQKQWAGEFLPHKDPETRYIFEVSSNATGSFAATAALGARLFDSYDAEFSQKLTEAALHAWQYLERHPEIQPAGGFKNPGDVVGGEYGDDNDTDVRLWAAIELYRLTGDRNYLEYFISTYPAESIADLSPLSWRAFGSFAFCSFLETNLPRQYENYKQDILQQLKARAEGILNAYEDNNYKTVLSDREYYWGSNSVALGYGYLLIALYRQAGDLRYYDVAMDQLHYNLGRNPFDKSFVTGVGANAVQYPYHQFSMEDGYERPVPGMLVGGPNNHVFLDGNVLSKYPGKNYEDSEKNYYVNEVAINWTAILAYTAGFFSTADDETISTNRN